jgi:hypothetical protein
VALAVPNMADATTAAMIAQNQKQKSALANLGGYRCHCHVSFLPISSVQVLIR